MDINQLSQLSIQDEHFLFSFGIATKLHSLNNWELCEYISNKRWMQEDTLGYKCQIAKEIAFNILKMRHLMITGIELDSK